MTDKYVKNKLEPLFYWLWNFCNVQTTILFQSTLTARCIISHYNVNTSQLGSINLSINYGNYKLYNLLILLIIHRLVLWDCWSCLFWLRLLNIPILYSQRFVFPFLQQYMHSKMPWCQDCPSFFSASFFETKQTLILLFKPESIDYERYIKVK